MLRKHVESYIGQLSDVEWNSTCKIGDKFLKTRIRWKYRSNLDHVLLICIGIANSIRKGSIQKGVA